MNPARARKRLANALRSAPFFSAAEIRSWEKRPRLPKDWLWQALTLSFATWGSSRGSEALADPAVRDALKYSTIKALPRAKRKVHLRRWFRTAGFRYSDTKAAYAVENFSKIEDLGGVEAATREALSQRGYDAKLRFMRGFKGIGPKYGRNIWMDVRDPEFMQSIAVDQRLKKVAAALALDPEAPYEELEAFFVGVAEDLGVTPWGLDRLLYRKNAEVLSWLDGQGTRS